MTNSPKNESKLGSLKTIITGGVLASILALG